MNKVITLLLCVVTGSYAAQEMSLFAQMRETRKAGDEKTIAYLQSQMDARMRDESSDVTTPLAKHFSELTLNKTYRPIKKKKALFKGMTERSQSEQWIRSAIKARHFESAIKFTEQLTRKKRAYISTIALKALGCLDDEEPQVFAQFLRLGGQVSAEFLDDLLECGHFAFVDSILRCSPLTKFNGLLDAFHRGLMVYGQSVDDDKELCSIAEGMLARGMQVNESIQDQGTILMAAAHADKYKLTQLFLSKGININAQDEEGFTALMDAASQTHPKVVALLLDKKACVDLKNNEGKTALDLVAGDSDNANQVKKLLYEAHALGNSDTQMSHKTKTSDDDGDVKMSEQ